MTTAVSNNRNVITDGFHELKRLNETQWDKSYISFRLSKLYSDLILFKVNNPEANEIVDHMLRCTHELAGNKLLEDKDSSWMIEELDIKLQEFFNQ